MIIVPTPSLPSCQRFVAEHTLTGLKFTRIISVWQGFFERFLQKILFLMSACSIASCDQRWRRWYRLFCGAVRRVVGCKTHCCCSLLYFTWRYWALNEQLVFQAITCVVYLDYPSYPPYISNGPIKRGCLLVYLATFYARSSYLVNIQLLIIPQRRIPHTKYTSTILLIKTPAHGLNGWSSCNWVCDTLQRVRIRSLWWALRDSNPRPSRCKRDALANWAKRPY